MSEGQAQRSDVALRLHTRYRVRFVGQAAGEVIDLFLNTFDVKIYRLVHRAILPKSTTRLRHGAQNRVATTYPFGIRSLAFRLGCRPRIIAVHRTDMDSAKQAEHVRICARANQQTTAVTIALQQPRMERAALPDTQLLVRRFGQRNFLQGLWRNFLMNVNRSGRFGFLQMQLAKAVG